MEKRVFVTRQIPSSGPELLKTKGYEVTVNPDDRVLSKNEIIEYLKKDRYDAVLCLLTDKIDDDVFVAAGPQCKIFANYAVGFDNIDLVSAKNKGVLITNTPNVLNETVAEHTFALMISIAHRVVEADQFMRNGKYQGWGPMLLLGTDLAHKKLGIVGLGRIGALVAAHGAKGFDMQILYYDPKRNEAFEKECNAVYVPNLDDLLKDADFVSIHVPLLPTTRHLISAEQLRLMKRGAYLINTSRGAIIDEKALAVALKEGIIRGAAIDVFEHEPQMEPMLTYLPNVIVTPHIASATEETRQKMSLLAAQNIVEALEGRVPPNIIRT